MWGAAPDARGAKGDAGPARTWSGTRSALARTSPRALAAARSRRRAAFSLPEVDAPNATRALALDFSGVPMAAPTRRLAPSSAERRGSPPERRAPWATPPKVMSRARVSAEACERPASQVSSTPPHERDSTRLSCARLELFGNPGAVPPGPAGFPSRAKRTDDSGFAGIPRVGFWARIGRERDARSASTWKNLSRIFPRAVPRVPNVSRRETRGTRARAHQRATRRRARR